MYYIGVDLGGTNIKAGLVSQDGKILNQSIIRTRKGEAYSLVLEDIAKQIQRLVYSANVPMSEVEHIGIGVPGVVDNNKGIVVRAVNIDFSDVPIREEFKKYFDVPMYIENDANCALLAESKFGVAKDYDNSIMITLGTGIGGGIIINKEVYRGINYAAGELGHMSIVFDGRKCSCGRRGCWEMYASAVALKNLAIHAVESNKNTKMYAIVNGDIKKIESRVVFAAAKDGDVVANDVLDEYISYLSFGIINLINIFQPGVIVIGGGISNAGEYFLQKVFKSINKSSEMGQDLEKRTQIKLASLGNDAGILGAAFLKEG